MRVKHILLPVIAIMLLYQCSKAPDPPRQLTEAEKRESYISNAKVGVELAIKEKIRDPKSFEMASEKYDYRDGHVYVEMGFRARNGFGGMNYGTAKAVTLESGHVTQLDITGEP